MTEWVGREMRAMDLGLEIDHGHVRRVLSSEPRSGPPSRSARTVAPYHQFPDAAFLEPRRRLIEAGGNAAGTGAQNRLLPLRNGGGAALEGP